MILGIMQPYFFPYLGYFELIARSDQWIVFDVVQYNPKSWMNRNRILHPSEGWQYVSVPVAKAPRGTLICDIRVKDMEAAWNLVSGQLQHYKKRAPFFDQIIELVRDAFDGARSDRLADLSVSGLVATCSYIKIPLNWTLCSEMDLDLSYIDHPGQWALKIASQVGARKYINPPGGREIFNPLEWEKAGIELEFTEMPRFEYACPPYEFVEHLSILDVLMWNSPEKVKTFLNERRALDKSG
ncbi:MAG: hypothetical protein C4548_13350 [Desulfobacteraceae bacterium]|nr:MAG: hypothetical protein C4548_13350 [Desulfobacteraceae bacterium]